VVAALATGLLRRGHDVTLMTAERSWPAPPDAAPPQSAHGGEVGERLFGADHAMRVLELVDAAGSHGAPFDIVHDHSGFAVFAVADRIKVPMLHTLHGKFDRDTYTFYRRHASKAWVSGLSATQLAQAPEGLRCVGVVPNPIDVAAWPFKPRKHPDVVWIGRMTPETGPHRAIAAARAAGRPLVLAGPLQPGQREFFDTQVAPHVDGVGVRYVGDVGPVEKRRLLAESAALLVPIRWREPFGMAMIEAMVCGTPVIAFREGVAAEVVLDAETGFLVDDEEQMATALTRLREIEPQRCRQAVAARYDVDVVAGAYEAAYGRVIAAA
jgi:glycosyltransferase involved in cell wall biosynthesis